MHLVWFMFSDYTNTLLLFPAGYQNHTQITTFTEILHVHTRTREKIPLCIRVCILNRSNAYLMLNKNLDTPVTPRIFRFSIAVNTVMRLYWKSPQSEI